MAASSGGRSASPPRQASPRHLARTTAASRSRARAKCRSLPARNRTARPTATEGRQRRTSRPPVQKTTRLAVALAGQVAVFGALGAGLASLGGEETSKKDKPNTANQSRHRTTRQPKPSL